MQKPKRVPNLDGGLAQRDGPPAPEVRIGPILVVGERSSLEDDEAQLPPVDVVGPLAELRVELHAVSGGLRASAPLGLGVRAAA